ncbi:MAG: mannose-1-phosphate guanylyltransferase/mannose-6-phosphate isomerase [Alphaproteobacteria bacterium]
MGKIYPVLLSGGAGSRLWPISVNKNPKQFTRLVDNEYLFENTVKRCRDKLFNYPTIICVEHHLDLVNYGLKNQNITNAKIILEPCARNTAPAILASALCLYKEDKDAVMMVMPSDHFIQNNSAFLDAAETALKASEKGFLTTFGIKPEYPETGFGYIKKGKKDNDGFFIIDKFVEKPNLETAKKYLSSGDYFWNSGMFMLKAQTLIDEMGKYEPEMLKSCSESLNKAKIDGNAVFLNNEYFAEAKSISFDYAVMERSNKTAVVIVNNSGWNDIGSYKSLWEISQKDEDGNVKSAKTVVIDSKNCFIKSTTKQLISVVGVDDLVVIACEDAIMVVPKDKSQDVRKIVEKLKEDNEKTYL